MKVGICAIMKDVNPVYLNEWINWHRLIGVDYFFIYDNESVPALKDLVKDPTNVNFTDFPGKIKQLDAYNDCLSRHKDNQIPQCDWIAFIDDDEYIMVANGTLKDLLKKQRNSGLALNWICYGAGEYQPDKPLIPRMLRHTPIRFESNLHIKSIVQPNKTKVFGNPHHPRYEVGGAVNIYGEPVKGAYTNNPAMEKAWINHYYCKSEKEFMQKIEKGRVDSPIPYSMDLYHQVNNAATITSDIPMKILNTNTKITQMRDENGEKCLLQLIREVEKLNPIKDLVALEIGVPGTIGFPLTSLFTTAVNTSDSKAFICASISANSVNLSEKPPAVKSL